MKILLILLIVFTNINIAHSDDSIMFHGYRVELYDDKNDALNKLRELCEFEIKSNDFYQCRSKNG
jgi:hypothetical protein